MAARPAKSGKKIKRVTKGTLRAALLASLRASSGRSDIASQFKSTSKAGAKCSQEVQLKDRAGYPVKLLRGSVNPKDWKTHNGDKIHVDLGRSKWLPDEWGQGVKITTSTGRSEGKKNHGNRGILTTFVAPDGKSFFHKPLAEQYSRENGWTKEFNEEAGRNGQIQLAKAQAVQAIELAREELRQGQSSSSGSSADADSAFFKVLSPAERKVLPKASEIHFCVVSARRATSFPGLGDIMVVEQQLKEAGVTPTWYVDADSLSDYRRLGLKAVVGGKLTAARNKALDDAATRGKACCQISDDISTWLYMHGKRAKERSDDAQNAAHSAARRIIPSPVAAARFILAKLRASKDPQTSQQPRLGGVYPLGSCARTFAGPEVARHNFIIGDFFVVDRGSTVRFDTNMNLKEDYDFTCSHIKAHGSVLRVQRLTLQVKHYSNSGGACSNRDKKGLEEKRNIQILNSKWPGCFRLNPKRANEVIMRWKFKGGACTEEDVEDKPIKKGVVKKRPAGR